MTLYDVVKKLVGCIEPYGDSCIDGIRSENLDEHVDITCNMVVDLIETAKFKNRSEHSIKIMGNKAYRELLNLKDMVDEVIENIE